MSLTHSVLLTMLLMNVDGHSGEGHLRALGTQRQPEGHVEILTKIPSVETFFNNYVKGSKPVVFKGASKSIPAYSKWTDSYMKKEFGQSLVDVEEGKKENRSLDMWRWPFEKFIDRYQSEDVYMVHSLGKEMRRDLGLFPSISCGGYPKVINDVVMWFSSGGTKSVLHNDHVDNINCLFSGSKRLYMVDWKYRRYIDLDNSEGSFSNVNVDAVDLNKYPGFSKAPWWAADMEAGDCLFIPSKWFHQVTSFADSNNRNLAVNLWFYNMKKINNSDCENYDAGSFPSLGDFELSNRESVRYLLLLEIGKDKHIDIKDLVDLLYVHSSSHFKKSEVNDMVNIIDKNSDKKVTLQEIQKLTDADLEDLSILFPMLIRGDHDTEIEDKEFDNIDKPLINKKDEL